jgi:cytoskeletal protein RodZ
MAFNRVSLLNAQTVSSNPPIPETPPALEAIGGRLRQARLDQGLSLGALANRLKMGQEQLTALESGDLERLPEPVFVIAQLRRVASSLGVDAEAAIQDLRHSDLLSPPGPRTADAGVPSPASRKPGRAGARRRAPTGWPWPRLLLALVGLPLLGWLALLGWRQLGLNPRLRGEPATAPPAGAEPRQRAAGRAAAAQLTLSSTESSWVRVRDHLGTTLFEGSFTGRRSFPLGKGLEVLAGRPDLVRASVGEAPPQALGPIEAVRWRRFTAPPP